MYAITNSLNINREHSQYLIETRFFSEKENRKKNSEFEYFRNFDGVSSFNDEKDSRKKRIFQVVLIFAPSCKTHYSY